MDGVRFALDDRPLELSARVHTISVDPGEHALTAHRGQTPLAFERVAIGGGAPLQLELALALPARLEPALPASRAAAPRRAAPAAATTPPPQSDAEPESSGSGVWLWAAGGAALAAAAVLTVVLVASGAEAMPVAGDTDPPIVRGRVR
jgi:hypothetical protein